MFKDTLLIIAIIDVVIFVAGVCAYGVSDKTEAR